MEVRSLGFPELDLRLATRLIEMGLRSPDVIKEDLRRVTEAINLLAQRPCVASHLAKKAMLEARLGRGDSPKSKVIIDMEAVLRAEQNGACDGEICHYYNCLGRKAFLEAELKLFRDKEFFERITHCSHIFYTGLDANGHTVTTCLGCGVSSDYMKHKGLSEYYKNQLDPYLANLFFNGDYMKYVAVSKDFGRLEEAQRYYDLVTSSVSTDETDPKKTVERMLELKRYEGR